MNNFCFTVNSRGERFYQNVDMPINHNNIMDYRVVSELCILIYLGTLRMVIYDSP